ncbi:hypothetical protein AAG570_004010 [Ranatra chinensis]|uniref:Glutathione peroxidase n=1 Tax=Ranatra chinensis TaxID=642074 RepID=A0ABD0YR43_9HEMI
MNALQSKYGDKLVVIGVPCNQFGLQEPAKNHTELMNGIKHVRPGSGFEPNFKLTAKVDVNGDNEIPLFTYLKKHCPSTRDGFGKKEDLFYHPFKNWDVRWNFEKFLIDPTGRPYMRYDPAAEPLEHIESDVVNLI